jgi:hypothetical protein
MQKQDWELIATILESNTKSVNVMQPTKALAVDTYCRVEPVFRRHCPLALRICQQKRSPPPISDEQSVRATRGPDSAASRLATVRRR